MQATATDMPTHNINNKKRASTLHDFFRERIAAVYEVPVAEVTDEFIRKKKLELLGESNEQVKGSESKSPPD
ncbi:hypothetical protein [Pelagibius sp.]|uniref:hypothetical protein n=1 Tax=Pelagibius sp. TaxID=1931238 RepID=UPI0026357546|nr:hypothetical protein [Pelagibius sp.]